MPQPPPFHAQSVGQVLASLKTRAVGLSQKEAAARVKSSGRNELPREPLESAVHVFLTQFASPLMLILLAASVVSALVGEQVDAVMIGLAGLINALVGFFQEWRAAQSMEHVRSLLTLECVVRRDGKDIKIPAAEVVLGDILVLRAGDRVPADARIRTAVLLEVSEAVLTGESLPQTKTPAVCKAAVSLADRTCMVFAGTLVSGGRGEAIVTATGINTEIGKVATLVSGIHSEPTPLQSQLTQLSRWIALFTVVCMTVIFVMSLGIGYSVIEAFKLSVAVAVGAIPEGLSLSVTVVLAVGMQRILKRGSLVRRLVAAETLGSVSVICTDKTGTLTEGNMQVSDIFPVLNQKLVLHIGVICNDALTVGSPTERALIQEAERIGIDPAAVHKQHVRHAEIPFSSVHKYMATLNDWPASAKASAGRGQAILMKGAVEQVLPRCRMSGDAREKLMSRAEAITRTGARVIALAYKPIRSPKKTIKAEDLHDLTFGGFVALRDPLRADAKSTIADARESGIRTVLITGDHPETAKSIALAAGMGGARAFATGEDIDRWSKHELARHVQDTDVFARVEPRHKIQIIEELKRSGEVVAMCGDGVNDAPALVSADVGVALGSGTDAAKEASDIVLLDDKLLTVTAAVQEGRVLFENIRKMTTYLLAGSFTEVVLIIGSLFLGLPLPLLPLQILWINLVADTFPNIGLAFESAEPGVKMQKPRPRNEPVANSFVWSIILFIGVLTDGVILSVFWLENAAGMPIDQLRSLLFLSVGLASLLYIFSIRTFHTSIWRTNPFANPWLLAGVCVGGLLLILPFVIPPLGVIMELVPIRASDIPPLLGLAFLKLIGIEIMKLVWMRKDRSVVRNAPAV